VGLYNTNQFETTSVVGGRGREGEREEAISLKSVVCSMQSVVCSL
jgi:hypothetical protein